MKADAKETNSSQRETANIVGAVGLLEIWMGNEEKPKSSQHICISKLGRGELHCNGVHSTMLAAHIHHLYLDGKTPKLMGYLTKGETAMRVLR